MKMKSNQMVAPIIDVAAGTVVFALADGKPDLVFHIDKCSDEVRQRAALVGMAQVRLVDAAAIGTLDGEGRVRSREERLAIKREAIQQLIEHYESGTTEWRLVRASGEGRGENAGLIITAIMRWRKCDIDAANMLVGALAAQKNIDRRAALAMFAKTKQVLEAMAEIRAEGAKGDADGLVAEILAGLPGDEVVEEDETAEGDETMQGE